MVLGCVVQGWFGVWFRAGFGGCCVDCGVILWKVAAPRFSNGNIEPDEGIADPVRSWRTWRSFPDNATVGNISSNS